MDEKKDSGTLLMVIMGIIIVIEVVVCIIMPLAVPTFSKESYALPLMIIALILPYIYFFIFGGIQVARNRAEKKREQNKQ
jgi:phosphotransferase system  glucose/maltose/N-acetylglucosamine-specific IIC component